MSARPNVPLNVVRVAVLGTYGDTTWVNTFWLQCGGSSSPTGTQMNAFAHSFLASYNSRLVPHRSTSLSSVECIMDWNDGAGNQVAGTDATSAAGAASGSALPASTACVISWRISQRYRGGHPRTYLGGIPASALNQVNNFASSFVSNVQTDVNNFFADINALTPAPFTSVVLGTLRQFARGGSETTPKTFLNPPVFVGYLSGIVKPGVATQRRRLGDNLN